MASIALSPIAPVFAQSAGDGVSSLSATSSGDATSASSPSALDSTTPASSTPTPTAGASSANASDTTGGTLTLPTSGGTSTNGNTPSTSGGTVLQSGTSTAPQTPSGTITPATPSGELAGTETGDISSPLELGTTFNKDLVRVDKNTGALHASYPITIPPGRNHLQPDVDLTYTSQDAQQGSIVGKGWSINIPYIERLNKNGVDNLYGTSTPTYFISSIDGELATTTNTSTYIARTDNGAFDKYTFVNNTWTMTDKNGTQFVYGSSTNSQENDPNNPGNVYRWMLQQVRDTNSNYVSYSYFKDAGQIYPSSTLYTGNGTTDGVFEVDFLRATSTDYAPSWQAGFSVSSNYRVSEIDAKVSGTLVRKYVLAYTTADNGSSTLLQSVTESGIDSQGNTVTLPPATFSYETSTPGWTASSSWYLPATLTNNSVDNGTRLADVNGDGLMDEIYSDTFYGTPFAYINNGHGWTSDSSWIPPIALTDHANPTTALIDVNGDGLPDILYANTQCTPGCTTSYAAYINNGHGWTSDSSWNLPVALTNGGGDNGYRLIDVNGDGLPDIVYGNMICSPASCTNYFETHINNGHGWSPDDPSWHLPALLTNNTVDNGTRLVDVNGDGLPDVVYNDTFYGTPFAYLNTGHGWASAPSWVPPAALTDHANPVTRLVDVNGDGLPDIVYAATTCAPGCTTAYAAYINNGHGWTSNPSWDLPVSLATDGSDNGYSVIDVNGDGLSDILYNNLSCSPATCTTTAQSYLDNTVARTDLLTSMTYPKGGSFAARYVSVAELTDSSGNVVNKVPYPVYATAQVSDSDGAGNVVTSTYQYAGGTYYYNGPYDRELAGFATTTETDPAGNVTKTFYHTANGTDSMHGEYQDNFWKIGKPYRVEAYDNAGHLYKKSINKWDTYALGGNAAFVKLAGTTEEDYDGLSTHRDTALAYTYDNATGNETEKIEWGEVSGSDDGSFTDVGTDKFVTDSSYATNTTGTNVIGKPSDVTVSDQNGNKIKESRYYYDGLALGSADKGNLTKDEDWKSGTSYVNVQSAYNAYGLVTQTLDPRGNTTTYAYDSFNLYPATTTNALGQAMQYQYDYPSGNITQTIDQNGDIFQNVFDGFGRPLQVKQPDATTSSTIVTKTAYAYTDTANAVGVHETDYLDASNAVDTYTYFDGLGRLLQTRKSSETSGTYKVADRAYNNLGLLAQESLPYFSSGSAKAAPTTTVALYTSYTYDPLGRVLTIANAVGTTSNVYANWKTTTTDPRGKPKDLTDDAYGNLARVDEHNGGSTYSTVYAYDGLKDLTSITDALGNVRNFTYDGLGRRLTAQDLHAPADSTFGAWTYVYDDAGNLTQGVDPKNQTVNYTYDALNRVLTEDFTGQSGTEVTYTYDTCTQGKPRLCTASSSDAVTSDTYDGLGHVAQETQTIASTTYATGYTYDRQGNQLTITNPDNSVIAYTYNGAGLVEQVSRKESGGAFTNVVSDFDYAPIDQPTLIAYANGASTVNTYDPTQVYRLTHKVSTLPGASKAQDLSYTYDADGNITQLVDASASGTGKTVAYTYDDLSRLTVASTTNVSTTPSYAQTFSYDALGNITSGPTGTYSYNGNTGTNYADPDAMTGLTVSTTTTSSSTTSTPAFVQGALDADHNAVTLSGAVTAGDLIVVGVTTWGQTIATSSIQDNKGNTYTRVFEAVNATSGDHAAVFYAKNVAGGSSFTVSSTLTGISISAQEYSGIATSTPLDLSASQTGLSTTPTSPNATTTIDHELYFGLAWSGGSGDTWTANSGFTLREQETDNSTHERQATEDKVVTTATTTAAKFTVTTSDNWIAGIATFKPATTAGGTSTVTTTIPYTYDNNGNLLTSGNATNTWNYRNELTQSLTNGATSTYAYDSLANRVKLVEGSTTTIFPSKFYGVMQGGNATSTKHIFADGFLLATVEDATTTSGGGSATSTVSLDATSTSITNGFNAGPLTKTWTHTLASSSTLLVVLADIWQDTGGTGTVATVTWKGTPFTKVKTSRSVNMESELWYLASPSTSTATGTISVTVTGATDAVKLAAASFLGVATSSPLDASSSATGTSGNPTISLTDASSSDVVIATLCRFSTTTASSNRTSLFKDTTGSILGAGSYQTTTATGIFSDTYTGSAAQDWAMVAGSFRPGTQAGTSTATTSITRYMLDDNLGGTGVALDASGTVVETLDYYPYGSARIDTKTGSYSGEKRKFDSMERDSATGLDYAQARYNDSSRGQFISQDPSFLAIGDPTQVQQNAGQDQQALLSDPQQLNSYSWGRDNPITQKDPSGKAIGIDDAAGAAIGGLVGAGFYLGTSISTRQFTWGGLAGGAVGGAIVGVGAVNTPETGGLSFAAALAVRVAAAAAVGGGAGFAGNLTKQIIDVKSGVQHGGISGSELAASTGMGITVGGLTEGLIPDASIVGLSSGKGNWNSTLQGLESKISNGTISSISIQSAFKGAIGSQVSNAYRTIAGGAVDALTSAGTAQSKSTPLYFQAK